MTHLRRSALLLPLIAFALAVTVAHVCVLPGHAHASAAVTGPHAHEDATHHHHDDGRGGSVHAEVCDVLRPASAVPAPPALGATSSGPTAEPRAPRAPDRLSDAAAPRASPPLYLTHRALLI